MISIRRALISVSDKTGILPFVQFLHAQGIEIIATGNTYKLLTETGGIPAKTVSDITDFPEILDGRVKTLHPKIHAGLLAIKSKQEHREQLQDLNIESIDLLVVNLYPFATTIAEPGTTLDEAVEQIDIGGPAMLRAAAKNYKHVVTLSNLNDYDGFKKSLQENQNAISEDLSFELACKTFEHVSDYDSVIVNYLKSQNPSPKPDDEAKPPKNLQLNYKNVTALRYGENPHQLAGFYKDTALAGTNAEDVSYDLWNQIQGKQLSYNNLLDVNAALEILLSLPNRFDTISHTQFSQTNSNPTQTRPATVIIKHLNPCGVAIAPDANMTPQDQAFKSFELARLCDPTSAFGGIVAISGCVDELLAKEITKNFVEILLAFDFTDDALEIFKKKKNLRILKINLEKLRYYHETLKWEFRCILGGLLYQQKDRLRLDFSNWEIVTDRKPNAEQQEALALAWSIVPYIKSNAIVFCSKNASIGIGAGQMSRIDSVQLAITKAQTNDLDLKNSVIASDAFFPFRDGIDLIAATGACAVVQPGGSLRDKEVIAAANEHNLIMCFTKQRHFLH